METLSKIKRFRVDRIRMIKGTGQKPRAGTLHLTATHLIFFEPKNETWILYMSIHEVKKKPVTKNGLPIEITCKNFQAVDFIFASEEEGNDVYESVVALGLPVALEELYAFRYQPTYDSTIDGWNFYSPEREYARLGVPNAQWQMTKVNENYQVCDTYSSTLFVPNGLQSYQIQGCARFRSRGRLPVLSYLYNKKVAICRCSQPMTGIKSKRSYDDEEVIRNIHKANPGGNTTMIVDTRPKVNAFANKAGGKGYENTEGYPMCELVFRGIENIHVMRDSLVALQKAIKNALDSAGSAERVHEYLSDLNKSDWLEHVRNVLSVSVAIKDYVINGSNVIVHCSDGWDRTAQTCSLSSLLLDPFYRTVEGYIVLIEKEWLGFGHKFAQRLGFLRGDPKEVSPIFLQFLECTWQVSQQFPRAFEFNELFLVQIYDCLVSSQFGTFLGNCEKERKELIAGKTHSVWAYLLHRKQDFMNVFYDAVENNGVLPLDVAPVNFKVWISMYCRYYMEILPKQVLEPCVRLMLNETSNYEAKLILLQEKIDEIKLKLALAGSADSVITENLAEDSIVAGALPGTPPLLDLTGIPYPPVLQSLETENCTFCGQDFLFLDRKIHCRSCGYLFCSQCASQAMPLPKFRFVDPMPVCKPCFKGRPL